MRLKVAAEKCTACHICENFCSFHHERVIWPAHARIRIWAEGDQGPFTPNICRQCAAERAGEGALSPCAEVCPVEAIAFEDQTGAWVVDEALCIGCGNCVEACPYEAIFLDEARDVAFKCDLCGGEPACAAMCPTGAVTVER
jgi:Fe-S-cluster-containing hydrogenase component 2